MSVKNFISRRNNSYNTVIRGLGSLVDTPGKLSAIINNYGIRNFSLENGGQDIYCNITGNYSLRARVFQYDKDEIIFGNVSSIDLAPLILSWEDYAGNIVNLDSEFSFRGSAIEHIHFPKLKTTGGRALYDMWHLKTANLGELETLDIIAFGKYTNLIFDCPDTVTYLKNFANYGGTHFTPNSFENVVSIGSTSPFNASTSLTNLASFDISLLNTVTYTQGRDLFFDMQSLEGAYSFQGIAKLNELYAFYRCRKITGLDLRNVTEITDDTTFYVAGASMLEIDLRSCITITLSSSNIFRSFKQGCTYHLNSALQDYDGNGTMHPQIQYLISNKNPTIIWY